MNSVRPQCYENCVCSIKIKPLCFLVCFSFRNDSLLPECMHNRFAISAWYGTLVLSYKLFSSGLMRTLFLLAGMPGSGKSTLLSKSYSNNLPIFGDQFHESFLSTNLDKSGMEFRRYRDAKLKRSFYHAVHIPKLRSEESLQSSILIHMDLRNILLNLSITHSECASPAVSRGILGLYASRRGIDLLDGAVNDLLVRNYLNDSFFLKFDRILVNTLICDFPQNFLQYEQKYGKHAESLFNADIQVSEKIHREIYQCWFRNLDVLSSARCLTSRIVGGNILEVDGAIVSASYGEL